VAAVADEDASSGVEEWQDWSEMVGADMADPAFGALVDEIVADQDRWAEEQSGS
jgi:hypothetical protein